MSLLFISKVRKIFHFPRIMTTKIMESADDELPESIVQGAAVANLNLLPSMFSVSVVKNCF